MTPLLRTFRLKAIQLLILSLFLAVDSPFAHGATYYVAPPPNGSDSNPGTEASPWATLQYAADAVEGGDTVVVKKGDYKPFHVVTPGTTDKRILFVSPNKDSKIDGYELYDDRYAAISVLADYITIEGFLINVGATDGTIKSRGIRISGTASVLRKGVIIRGNSVSNAGWVGITTSFAQGVLIEDNEVWGSKRQHGIYVANSADNPVIRGNIVHDNPQAGIQINADATEGNDGIISNALIEDNVIYNNGEVCCGSIELDGAIFTVIRNNVLFENKTSGINNYKGDGAEASHDNKIFNNTIVMPSGSRHGISLRSGSINNEIKNNIIVNIGSGDSIAVDPESYPGLDSDYNILTRVENPSGAIISLPEWQSNFRQDLNSFVETSENLFLDATTHDYHPKEGSPAINSGVTLISVTTDIEKITRPQGGLYDVGAYEFPFSGDPSPDTTPPSPPANLKIN